MQETWGGGAFSMVKRKVAQSTLVPWRNSKSIGAHKPEEISSSTPRSRGQTPRSGRRRPPRGAWTDTIHETRLGRCHDDDVEPAGGGNVAGRTSRAPERAARCAGDAPARSSALPSAPGRGGDRGRRADRAGRPGLASVHDQAGPLGPLSMGHADGP